MRVRFDKRVLTKLEPRSTAYEVQEEGGPPGFCVRVQPSGTRTYYWLYKFKGKRRRLRLGDVEHMSVADARKAYNAAVALRDRGVDPFAQEKELEAEAAADDAAQVTVAEVCRRYLGRREAREKRTHAEDVRQVEHDVLPKWGRRPIREISKRDVHELVDEVAERAPVAANRLLALLKPLFEYAEERDIIPASPAASVRRPTRETKRERVLTLDECKALLKGLHKAKMGDRSRWVVRLLILTGQRLGEVSGARWSEFDGKAWNLPGERTKNGKAHKVPITPLLQAVLDHLEVEAKGSIYVFPTASPKAKSPHIIGESVSSALGKERDDANRAFGVDHFRLHDLRRTVATQLGALGIEYEVIARILNHSLAGITARYNVHDYWQPACAGLESWHDQLLKITKPKDWPGIRLP